MSLIQEALDKVQEKRFRKESVKAPSSAAPEPDVIIARPRSAEPAKVKKEAQFTTSVAGAAIAVAAVTLILVFVLFGSGLGSAAKKSTPARPAEVKQNVIYKPIVASNEEKPDAASAAQAVITPVIEAMAKTSSAGMPKLILNGIMYIEGNPRAIVNGYTVSVGDSVSGAVVKEIRKDSVVFNANNTEITIDLK